MEQVSRDSNLKIPKQISIYETNPNNINDTVAIKKAKAIADDKRFNEKKVKEEAIVKLKLLGYVSMVAESSGCILKRQYKQISMQLSEDINLIIAWKKSDDNRFKNKN